MYIYIYIYMYLFIYIYICLCMCIYIYMCICKYTKGPTLVIWARVELCKLSYEHKCSTLCIHILIYMYICIFTRTHTHTHTHTRTFTQASTLGQEFVRQIHTNTHKSTFMCLCKYIDIRMYTYICTHLHASKYAWAIVHEAALWDDPLRDY